MCRDRFKFLLSKISFVDPRSRPERCETEFCKTELECLKLFITEQRIDVIVENTNIVIAGILQGISKVYQVREVSILKLTTQEEISALLGRIYYRGLYNLTNISTSICFCDAKGFFVFGAVMIRGRLKLLVQVINNTFYWLAFINCRQEFVNCRLIKNFLKVFFIL